MRKILLHTLINTKDPGTLHHTAYLDALRSLNSTDSEWKVILAGFLILRLVDTWLARDIVTVDHPISFELQAAQDSLNNVPADHPVRPILQEITTSILDTEQPHIRAVAVQLIQYGDVLRRQGQWHLSEDVFVSLLRQAYTAHATIIIIEAAGKLGTVWRSLGYFKEAEQIYSFVDETARRVKNVRRSLTARLGINGILMANGDFIQSEALLNTVAIEAEAHTLTDVLLDVSLDQSCLCYLRQDYTRLIQTCRSALECVTDASLKEFLLGNLGAGLMSIGDFRSAETLFHSLSMNTGSELIRQSALLNLLQLAAWESKESRFDFYRHELSDGFLLPHLQANRSLFLAEGFHTFGHTVKATEELHRAIDITTAYGLMPILQRAKHQLATIEQQR